MIRLEEVQVRAAEADPSLSDDHVLGTGPRIFDILEGAVRMPPDTAANQGSSRFQFDRRKWVLGARIPCSFENECFHETASPRIFEASSSSSRAANTLSIASAYCSINAGG